MTFLFLCLKLLLYRPYSACLKFWLYKLFRTSSVVCLLDLPYSSSEKGSSVGYYIDGVKVIMSSYDVSANYLLMSLCGQN